MHEKYVVNISARKASKAREKAQEFVDGPYREQYYQLWDYLQNRGDLVLVVQF